MRQGPLAGRYPAVVAMVMLALVPYLALSAALSPLTPIIARQLHMSLQTMSLSSGMANAAYAVGTVLAVQFAQHLPQRRMMVVYATLLLLGSVLAATAQDPTTYIVGHVLQGLCTSLLLISAVPPLAIGYPASKLHTTAMIMNLCIFGAVALGPAVGGLLYAWHPAIPYGIAGVMYLTAALMMGAGPRDIIRRVVLPAALPSIFTGLRIGLGIGWTAVIVSEMVAVKSGLGYVLWDAYYVGRMDIVIADMVSIGLFGFLSDLAIVRLEYWALRWRPLQSFDQ